MLTRFEPSSRTVYASSCFQVAPRIFLQRPAPRPGALVFGAPRPGRPGAPANPAACRTRTVEKSYCPNPDLRSQTRTADPMIPILLAPLILHLEAQLDLQIPREMMQRRRRVNPARLHCAAQADANKAPGGHHKCYIQQYPCGCVLILSNAAQDPLELQDNTRRGGRQLLGAQNFACVLLIFR